jgi:nucleotide-binding universal stress UspA family protein
MAGDRRVGNGGCREAREELAVGLLGRLVFPSGGKAAKVIDGLHPAVNRPGADESTPTDILPLPEGQERREPSCKLNILVAVTGTELDKELVSLASNIAKQKKVDLYGVYGIQVPRTLPVDADMPGETGTARSALEHAETIADRIGAHMEAEIIQSRHYGQSLVDEADTHGCALVVLGLPYRVGRQGHFDLGETADYVLKNAPCRVWVVRGQPPEGGAKPEKMPASEQVQV